MCLWQMWPVYFCVFACMQNVQLATCTQNLLHFRTEQLHVIAIATGKFYIVIYIIDCYLQISSQLVKKLLCSWIIADIQSAFSTRMFYMPVPFCCILSHVSYRLSAISECTTNYQSSKHGKYSTKHIPLHEIFQKRKNLPIEKLSNLLTNIKTLGSILRTGLKFYRPLNLLTKYNVQHKLSLIGRVYFTDRTMTYGPDWNFTDQYIQ